VKSVDYQKLLGLRKATSIPSITHQCGRSALTSVVSYISCVTLNLLTHSQPMFTAKYRVDMPGGRNSYTMRSQRERVPSIISYKTHSQTVDLPGRSRSGRIVPKDLSAYRHCCRPEYTAICEGVGRNIAYFCQINYVAA
jgi:hypothetical protein